MVDQWEHGYVIIVSGLALGLYNFIFHTLHSTSIAVHYTAISDILLGLLNRLVHTNQPLCPLSLIPCFSHDHSWLA